MYKLGCEILFFLIISLLLESNLPTKSITIVQLVKTIFLNRGTLFTFDIHTFIYLVLYWQSYHMSLFYIYYFLLILLSIYFFHLARTLQCGYFSSFVLNIHDVYENTLRHHHKNAFLNILLNSVVSKFDDYKESRHFCLEFYRNS